MDNTLATALIDRLMHHGEAVIIQGPSHPMKRHPLRFDQCVTKRGAATIIGVFAVK